MLSSFAKGGEEIRRGLHKDLLGSKLAKKSEIKVRTGEGPLVSLEMQGDRELEERDLENWSNCSEKL